MYRSRLGGFTRRRRQDTGQQLSLVLGIFSRTALEWLERLSDSEEEAPESEQSGVWTELKIEAPAD
jgi:hypothetical protein